MLRFDKVRLHRMRCAAQHSAHPPRTNFSNQPQGVSEKFVRQPQAWSEAFK